MKKFLLIVMSSLTFFAQADIATELQKLSGSLQNLAQKIDPSLKGKNGNDVGQTIDKLIAIEKRMPWSSKDADEYSVLLGMLKLTKADPKLIAQYEGVFEERKDEPKLPMKKPKKPVDKKPEVKEKKKPPMRKQQKALEAFKAKAVVTQADIEKARQDLSALTGKINKGKLEEYKQLIDQRELELKKPEVEEQEQDEMALALQGLEELSQKQQWTDADLNQFDSLLAIIQKGDVAQDVYNKYDAIYYERKAQLPLPSVPGKLSAVRKELDKLAAKIEWEEADIALFGDLYANMKALGASVQELKKYDDIYDVKRGEAPAKPEGVIVGVKKDMRPSFVVFIKKPVYTPSPHVEIPSTREKVLSASIGIVPDDNLVAWGPELRDDPTLATFFKKADGTFGYPFLDEIVHDMVKVGNVEKVKADYYLYTLLNMEELKKQKELFDALQEKVKKFVFTEYQLGNMEATDFAQYVKAFGPLVKEVIAAFANKLLDIKQIHPKPLNDMLDVTQVQKMLSNIKNALDLALADVQKREKHAQDQKQTIFEQWKQEGTTEGLLEGRWQKDPQGKVIEQELNQLPELKATLESIDLTPLESLESKLKEQAGNKELADLDSYYRTLKKEKKEPAPKKVAEVEYQEEQEEEYPPLTDDEETELDNLRKKITDAMKAGKAPQDYNAPELEAFKQDLQRYLILRRKDEAAEGGDPDWRPIKDLFHFYNIFGVKTQ